VLLYAVIFGGDVFINEAENDWEAIGIKHEDILKHPNLKI